MPFLDPNGNGSATSWTGDYTGIDDAVRDPNDPGTGDSISYATVGTSVQESESFPDTATWHSGDQFVLHAHGIGATKRKIQYAISVNNGSNWSSLADIIPNIATGPTRAWYSADISSLITSQTDLNGLQVGWCCVSTGGGNSGTVYVYCAYVEQILAPIVKTGYGKENG